MHHYGTNVALIGSRARVLEIWRDYIPQQALKHPFLMHMRDVTIPKIAAVPDR